MTPSLHLHLSCQNSSGSSPPKISFLKYSWYCGNTGSSLIFWIRCCVSSSSIFWIQFLILSSLSISLDSASAALATGGGRLGQGGSFGNQWRVLCIACRNVPFRIGQARANGRCWLMSFDWACRLGRWWPNRRCQRGRHLSGGLHLHAGAWFFHPQSCCCTWHCFQFHFHTNRGRHTRGLHIGR